MADDSITVYDELGRPLEIERGEWAANVLPRMLEEAWDHADVLYQRIVHALEDGFASDVADAADRLGHIDPDVERSSVILAIVALQTGDLAAAEQTLEEFVEKHGPTGVVLTNLAKVQHERGDPGGAIETLRRGLDLDPNQDNGLDWWGALHHERGGDEAYCAAMSEIAEVPGSWRPQLWLAREHLKRSEEEQAMRLYEQALELCEDDPDALMMISGDLGSAGGTNLVVELLEDRYDPARHGPYAGLNLVRALQEERRIAEAQSLLRDIQRLNVPQLAEVLAEIERELLEASDLPAVEPGGARILLIDGPIWGHASDEVAHLLPTVAPVSERILFLSLADCTRSGEEQRVEGVTDFGRFARSLPLYLAEALRFRTDAATMTFVPVVDGVGPILPGEPWDLDWLLEGCPADDRPDIVVYGALAETPRGAALEVAVHDWRDGREVGRLTFDVGYRFDSLATRIESEVTEFLEKAGRVRRRRRSGIFVVPQGDRQAGYLSALGNLLTQVLVLNEIVDASRVTNERGMLASYFDLAAEMPGAAIPRIMAARGVLTALRSGSPVGDHFVGPLRSVLKEQETRELLESFGRALEEELGS